MMLKSPENKTSEEAHRILSNKIFHKEVENTTAFHPKKGDKCISQLHIDRDVCKGNTDIPKNATQGCSATLKLDKGSAKRSLMATSEEAKPRTSRTPRPSVVGGCQFNLTTNTTIVGNGGLAAELLLLLASWIIFTYNNMKSIAG